MSHDTHVSELLPGYALGCLDAAETESVACHLTHCAQCRAELEAFQAVADQLGFAVPDASASSGLKSRILSRIQPEKHIKPAPSLLKRERPDNAWQQILRIFRPAAPVWAITSIFIIVALAAGNWTLWQRLHSLEHEYRIQGFQKVTLQCTHVVPEAVGQILISEDGNVGTLIVAHLPGLDPEYRYQIWLVVNGQQIPGETFMVNRNGYGAVKLLAPQSLLDCEFEITIEPENGSPEPTGQTVLKTMV